MVDCQRLRLAEPAVELRPAYLALLDELDDTNCAHFTVRRVGPDPAEFESFVRGLRNESRGVGLPAGYVPQTTFWLMCGDDIVGEVRIRHTLTSFLENFGGHIGYAIRPSERRKGYGTVQLKLALVKAREIGLRRALVTCNPRNIGSARIIEKNGGIRDTDGVHPDTGEANSRYWIEL